MTILQTKIRPPVLLSGLVPRPRLLELFKRSLKRPLTLVSAPAGYGKSTAVAQWVAAAHLEPAWLQLGAGDGDLRRFSAYLVAAVRARFPEACPHTAALLDANQMPSASVLADTLCNDLDAIDVPFTLVLDDYHRVADAAVHELLDHLLQFPPRPLHLVLITRHDPPMSLPRLRARGWLTEIRHEDLRFTRTEMKEVLQEIGVSASVAALAHLEEQMEGWIAGLHLVGLVLRDRTDPEGFLIGLKGGLHQVHDYLIAEVLATQTVSVRECLLRTSLLKRFCAPLVEALCRTELDDGPVTAAEMSGEGLVDAGRRANLFVIPLDAQGEWFRYHHLFRDLLRRQLEQRQAPGDIPALHGRASEWFEAEGLITDAIEHALAAGAAERAADIVERHRCEELAADRWYVLEQWLAMLPTAIRQERPLLLLAEAWIATGKAELTGVPMITERVESLLRDRVAEPLLSGELAFFEGALAYWEGDAERSCQLLEAAVPRLAGEVPYFESEAQLTLGLARCMAGQRGVAIQALEDRIDAAHPSEGQVLSRLLAGEVFIQLVSADLTRASIPLDRLRTVAKKNRILNTEAWSAYMQASCHLHAGELETASRHFSQAVEQRYVLESVAAVDSLAGLALTQQLLQANDAAAETAGRLLDFARELDQLHYHDVARSCHARLSVLRGDAASEMAWARSVDAAPTPATTFMWSEVPAITRARVLIAEGSDASLRQAVDWLQMIVDRTEAWRFTCQTIEARVLLAMALERQGRAAAALTALREAITLAEPGPWARPFIELGRPMADLLRRLVDPGDSADFVQRLVAASEGQPGAVSDVSAAKARPLAPVDADPAAVRPPITPLTNRETDVLERLSERLYDKEIARSLSISVWTVRTHVKHVFEKLHVTNRREAVLRAEALGLLKNR